MKSWLLAILLGWGSLSSAMAFDRTQIAENSDSVTPLLNGQTIPQVSLKTHKGEMVDLNKLIASKPSILVFYRGGWCPYCSRHLAGLREYEAKFVELGYQVIAISPDSPEKLQSQEFETGSKTMVLSDYKLEVTRHFGLAYFMDEKMASIYKNDYGIPFVDLEGTDRVALPVPAAYVLDTSGMVQFNYVNPNFKVRVSEQLLYDAAKASLVK